MQNNGGSKKFLLLEYTLSIQVFIVVNHVTKL